MSTATSAAPGSASASKQDDKPASTGWLDMIKQTVKDFGEDNAMRLAAAMACYIMLALAPMLVVSLKVLVVVFRGKTHKVVEGQINHLIGPAGADAIKAMLDSADKGSSGILATIVS